MFIIYFQKLVFALESLVNGIPKECRQGFKNRRSSGTNQSLKVTISDLSSKLFEILEGTFASDCGSLKIIKDHTINMYDIFTLKNHLFQNLKTNFNL